jgi:hypothetical protein
VIVGHIWHHKGLYVQYLLLVAPEHGIVATALKGEWRQASSARQTMGHPHRVCGREETLRWEEALLESQKPDPR